MMLDLNPDLLAQQVWLFLLPHLEYVRGKVVDGTLVKTGHAIFDFLKAKFTGKPAAEATLDEAAGNPDDADMRDALLAQIRGAIKEDLEFAAALRGLLPAGSMQVAQTGDGNKAVQIQGSGNTVSM